MHANSSASAFNLRDENNNIPSLSVERARTLVRSILRYDDDGDAQALIALITGIAYEPDLVKRDELALFASCEAFTMTKSFSDKMQEFAASAAVRAGK